MKSKYAEKFSHDADASGYDVDVRNEVNPIRTGYRELLDWVIAQSPITAKSAVLDLGSGTGNTSTSIQEVGRLVCVDISSKMTAIAQKKLKYLKNVAFVQADILDYFSRKAEDFDVIVSTYAIHHLTEDEKEHLFTAIKDHLKPDGRAVFGDLMFKNASTKENVLKKYKKLRNLSSG